MEQLTKFSEKCPLVRDISIFWALPGAHARGRVRSPPRAGKIIFEIAMILFCMCCCWIVFREFCGFTKEFFVIVLEGIWIGKSFPKLVMAISYVQMLVSVEHVVAAMVSELLEEKDTVLSRSLC